MSFFKKLFGTKHDRDIKKLRPMAAKVGSLADAVAALSDDQLRGKTAEFRGRIERGEALDDLLPEAFAVVREGAWRVLGMRHYDVQLIGGAVLHQGKIAEMKTGEGKTLVATLPVYLNALSGKGVHVITVNDYLAERDSAWMGQLYRFLGLEVGCILRGLDNEARRNAYNADLTYGTNSEMGFDYLRDNMKLRLEDYVQRGHNYAIVDEVDSILIDEARTPLIISGQAEGTSERYLKVDQVVPRLQKEIDFSTDLKTKSCYLNDEGVDKVQELMELDNLYDPKNVELLHTLNQALRAHNVYRKDVEYVVEGGKVIIVDEFTGRKMPGRRWSDGLHQAIEAKERVAIEPENRTVATVTYQNFFLLYDKLSGMTGTADTEAEEFTKIYSLDVVVIPTNKPIMRTDFPDLVYKTEVEKFQAVANEIEEINKGGQPILVGTTSVERSELLSRILQRKKIPHEVLNAKNHGREATIVAQAGRLGAVTIATNMAGRGTDILLGGNPEHLARERVGEEAEPVAYKEALDVARAECEAAKQKVLGLGGLIIVGTERHDSRRVDNQLRGRAGRQGDPGGSRFYLSLEDQMMKAFGTDRVTKLMDRMGYEEGVPLEHPFLSKAIENAQKKLEGYHFGIRKSLKEYDDVLNQQREIFYGIRRKVLEGEGTKDLLLESIDNIVTEAIEGTCSPRAGVEEWDLDGLKDMLMKVFDEEPVIDTRGLDGQKYPTEALRDRVADAYKDSYQEREEHIGEDLMRRLEREVLLKVMDRLWMDHLSAMDHLRDSVRLRGMGQRNPLLEYKREGYNMFQIMYALRDEEVLSQLFRVRRASEDQVRSLEDERKRQALEQLSNWRSRPAAQQRAQAQAQAQAAGRPTPGAPPPGATPVRILLPPNVGPEFVQRLQQMGPEELQQTLLRLKLHREQDRNLPCWCGSGSKYKKCHMASDLEELGAPPREEAAPAPSATQAEAAEAAATPTPPTIHDAPGTPPTPPGAEAPAPVEEDAIDDGDDDMDLLVMGDPLRRG